MITQKPMRTTANEGIISGARKTSARACESCLKSRARWFCPADDAFLCHSCDSSVHSANDLATRHNRVPLQTPSFHKPANNIIDDDDVITTTTTTPANQPTWHQGFQKKARTPRHHHPKKEHMKKKTKKMMMNTMMVVPEMSGDEEEKYYDDEEEHMVFSVPTFDPFDHHRHEEDISNLFGFEGILNDHDHDHQKSTSYWDNLLVFDDHDHDHVESLLLDQGTDEDQVVYSSSSTVPCPITTSRETGSERLLVPGGGAEEGVVKVEEEEDGIESSTCEDEFDFWAMELENEVLMNNNNLEVGKGNSCGGKNEEGEKKEGVERELMEEEEGNYVEMEGNKNKMRKIFLRLNYEEVINSWFGSSPWTTGCRPQFDLDRDGWPNAMGGVDPMYAHYQGWGVTGERKYTNGGDDGREARVSRYREKRRTRLFSKKIRYEVRKLNAEKRPRLKGRFVKRTSLTPALGFGSNFPYMNK